MSRISVPDGPGGRPVNLWRLQPHFGRLVEQMVDTVYHRSLLPAAEREVARMRIAQLNACGACATFRAPSVRAQEVDEEIYLHVDDPVAYAAYSERQRLAITYAERFVLDHEAIDDAFFERLRARFSDEEVLDLTMCIAVYLGLGRALAVLGIDEPAPIDI